MDLFQCMTAFAATARAGSMSGAAGDLGVSPALVGQRVAALEAHLGTRLLNRTTRRQSLTPFGRSYLDLCQDILERVALADREAEATRTQPRGILRVTAPVSFGAESLMPALGGYRARAPDVRLDILLTDRRVDLVEEAVDVAFRIGEIADGPVIARPLAPYRMRICAAPAYLARAGMPRHPSDLTAHEAVGFTPAAASPWRLSKGDEVVTASPTMPILVNSGQAVRQAGRAGLGLILQPALLVAADIRSGALVPVLEDWSLPSRSMSLVYYRDRAMTPRLRSFITFALETFGPSP